MYGFVNSALEKLICRRFGKEKWEEIRDRSKIHLGEKNSFMVHTVYNDDDTYLLVGITAEVLGLDPGTILEMFGEQFLVWCKESGYAKILQLLGRSLQDFLTNLDALHDHLSIIYPQMDAPSFRCTGTGSDFYLHYYSSRPGLESIVKGIVKTVAREFYGVEVEMTLMSQKGAESDHSLFHISEIAYHPSSQRHSSLTRQGSIIPTANQQLISTDSFCRCFPFHIVFDRDMNMLQVGVTLSWILPGWNQPEKCLNSFFVLERPRMKLSFENIRSYINTIFILRLVSHSQANLTYIVTTNDPMRLRGQMVYLPESECMLFLCSPRVSSIKDLDQRGLYLSDIPMHDATRGLLMMSQTAASEFHNIVQLEELIGKLNVAQKSLEEEKGRMRDLLHQMLPISVADSLMAGQMIEAERFDSVTILFSDIVGFTSICGKCEPIQVVSMLNKLYTLFDQVVGRNKVYKVETIGDAYMVVGGLPEENPIHAECVANQALDMMYYCKQVIRPDSTEPIQMRIGIHSGPVVAGVVGTRMPRYCLFGNTVNMASRTEANGEPGMIQVTQWTHELLKDKENFKFTARGAIQFKNVSEPTMCYFLDENTEKGEYLDLEVPEEISYDFMQKSDSPPSTPYSRFSGSIPSVHTTTPLDSPSKKRKFPLSPEVRVIDPTPIHTPDRSPPREIKSGLKCPFSSPVGGVGGASLDQMPMRKVSMESNVTETTGSMTTPTESDVSTEDFNYPSPPSLPPIRVQESSPNDHTHSITTTSSSNIIESVIQSLSKSIFPVKEDSQEDLYSLEVEHTLQRITSAPLVGGDKDGSSMTLPRAKKRTVSMEHKNLRNARSLSCTSEESGGEEETEKSSMAQAQKVSPVRYVRPRSSSIKERVRFFEGTELERKTSGGGTGGASGTGPSGGGGSPGTGPSGGGGSPGTGVSSFNIAGFSASGTRRRTGLATTSYLQSELVENGPSKSSTSS